MRPITCSSILACLIVTFGFLSQPLDASQATRQLVNKSIPLAQNGTAQSAIIVGISPSESTLFAASEMQKYLTALSGAPLKIVSDAEASKHSRQTTQILIGNPENNSLIREAVQLGLVNFAPLKPGGYLLKSWHLKHQPIVVVGGNDEAATLYAVYEFIEQLGVTFLLTGDVIPAKQDSLQLPGIDLRREPAFSRRGFLLQIAGFDNLTMFSTADYEKFIDQMAKMRCNYLQLWWFAFAPWLKHSYRGETMWMGDVSTKESGYLSWAHSSMGSRTTDDVTIGKERFPGRRIAPPEFQNVETPDQGFEVAQTMLSRVIQHAKHRHVKVWLAIEMAALPPNLAQFTERVGALPFHPIFGTFVHPLDPVNREIQVERLKSLINTYPDVEGYFLVLAELYPELNTEKYHEFFAKERPKYHEVRNLRYPWIEWGAGYNTDRLIDNSIGYVDLFQFLLSKSREFAPQAKLGLLGIGRGYVFPVLDKILPKEIPFSDMESSGVWTPAGVPMQYFGDMGERERTLEQRIDDDVNMMGMQFSVKQYALKDRIFSEGARYGLSGHAGQVQRARGTETNSRYSAEAAWNPNLSPEEFYKNYSRRLFGEHAAEAMFQAFMLLEENEAHLGYYNHGYSTMNCCGALPEVRIAYNYSKQENPFDGPASEDWKAYILKSPGVILRYQESLKLLDSALGLMHQASVAVTPGGRFTLNYMINRTESYRGYIQSLITMRQAYVAFDRAFKNKSQQPKKDFVLELENSLRLFDTGRDQVEQATRHYAEIIDHPSDLAVLYHLNARAILGFGLARQWMTNVVNFYRDQPYLQHVPFERLFSPDLHVQWGGLS
ncbi:MAG: alpha-glucuronidase family glycosyl hydrolase [Terriglobia bacterium]